VVHVPRIFFPQAAVQRVTIHVLLRDHGEFRALRPQPRGGAQRADDAGRLVGVLSGGDNKPPTDAVQKNSFHRSPLPGDSGDARAAEARERRADLSRRQRFGRCFNVNRFGRRLGWDKSLLQRDADPRGSAFGPDVGKNLAGLERPVAEFQACVALKELQRGKIQILVQTLGRAQALVMPAKPPFDAGAGNIDF
jgi:hypothetical protein